MKSIIFKYVGRGEGIIGVPARNLTQDDLEKRSVKDALARENALRQQRGDSEITLEAFLELSALYEPNTKPKASEAKPMRPSENK